MPIFLLIFSMQPLSLQAELEYHGETKQISRKYYDGIHLIYDCSKGHWACVDLDGFMECKKDREEARKDYKRNLSCAAFKEFKTKKECESYQQKKVNNPEGKKFCSHSMIKRGTTK